MPINDPTPVAALSKAADRRFAWGSSLFQTIGSVAIRPATTEATKTVVKTNVKDYTMVTKEETYENLTLNVAYDATVWDTLDAARKAGTVHKYETDDGFDHNAVIASLAEVSAEIGGTFNEMGITFAFVDDPVATT